MFLVLYLHSYFVLYFTGLCRKKESKVITWRILKQSEGQLLATGLKNAVSLYNLNIEAETLILSLKAVLYNKCN